MHRLSQLADATMRCRPATGRARAWCQPATGRDRDGQVRRPGAELRQRRRRHLRLRRRRGPADSPEWSRARMMQICGQVAWPVDANLRPEGSQGRWCGTLAAHLRLLRPVGPDVGVQALLKARPAVGRPGARRGVAGRAAAADLARGRAARRRSTTCARMRRRIIDNVPPAERGPRDQARAGRAARHRVRRPAAAARARARRRGAAVRRPHWTHCGRSPARRLRRPRRTARRWSPRTASCARSSTACSCNGCGARTPCPTAHSEWRGRAALARPGLRVPRRCPARRGRGVSASTGSRTPRRYAGCTRSCVYRPLRRGGGHGCPARRCG